MNKLDYNDAHKHSFSNRQELTSSKLCGCFNCLTIFSTSIIEDWTDFMVNPKGNTAVCPFCSIDSILGDTSGYPITEEFLCKMNEVYFKEM